MEAEEFIKPPEAPVFQPTHEEFKDPIAYLSKIRPVVINTGICKIKPPSVSSTIPATLSLNARLHDKLQYCVFLCIVHVVGNNSKVLIMIVN